jgi:hypothetical protein
MKDLITKLSYKTCNAVFDSSDIDSKSVWTKYILKYLLFMLFFNDGQK